MTQRLAETEQGGGVEAAPERATGQASPAFDIPRLEWGAWDDAFRVGLLVPLDTPPLVADRFSASARLGWNDDGLLVRVTVVGTASNTFEPPDELWKGASVQIVLSPAPDSPDRCQWVLAPSADPRLPEPRWHFHDHRQAASLRKRPADITATCRRTADGYQVDARLPWQALAIEPERGREVSCQIMVGGHPGDDRPQDYLWWYPQSGAYNDSRKMHRLRLANSAGPPLRLRGVSRLNLQNSSMQIDVLAPAAMAGELVGVDGATPVELVAGDDGYAHAQLGARLPDRSEIELTVAGEVVDVVPLLLPASFGPARRLTLETRLKGDRLTLSPECRVRRRPPGGEWREVPADIPIERGRLYEYAVVGPGETPARDYFYAGLEAPSVERRGTAVLVVEETLAGDLEPEIHRLLLDWVGDGWHAAQCTVASNDTPVAVKELIQAQSADAVLLLGSTPVPYSGQLFPDGHPEHAGAWPADAFYGTGDDGWTDTEVDHTNANVDARHHNVPGDGKYDQSVIPAPVLRAVGRVDFRDLPAFKEDETTLYRRYLDRLHAYRHGALAVQERGWVQDGFFGHAENFAYSGWQNLTTLLGAEQVADGRWPNFPPEMQLWFMGCGAGGANWMHAFGSTDLLAVHPLNAVFTLLFGSYFGDWALPNNLMRGVLASEGGALTCAWAGRPHWYLHPMGMGATIGDCLALTQNNGADDYPPTGGFARGVHIALLGDPTLRMHRVAPPTDLRAEPGTEGVRLEWRASHDETARYHVYRAKAELGPYERLTADPLADCGYHDADGTPADRYMLRALALQDTPTGSYFNMSQGTFAEVRGDRIE